MTVLATGGGAAAPPGPLAAVSRDQISYSFGTHTAVDQVDLRLEPGETFGLLGPNGAGKPNIAIGTSLYPTPGRSPSAATC